MTEKLPAEPRVTGDRRQRLERLATVTARQPPAGLAQLVREELRIDLTARYGGLTLAHPFGKASGQLSCTLPQVQADVEQGIAFIVLKTVIAEDSEGQRSMAAWTVKETRMKVERRKSAERRDGWTVTWKGRGWHGTLSDYLEFFEQALGVAKQPDVPVVPSVKYHLPGPDEPFRTDEYRYTNSRLLEVWARAGCGGAMVLEKDFSPTLAADDRARHREAILRWLAEIPGVIAAASADRIRLGLKLMNALFDDEFQCEMFRAATAARPAPAFLVVFNRLFDSRTGVAYGGFDLSERNLRVLDRVTGSSPPLCGTGNIGSGRMMLEYALRGCASGQLHTFFQLPLTEYTATAGGRTARALHTLLFHPRDGLIVWLWHLNETGSLEQRDGVLHFLDAVR